MKETTKKQRKVKSGGKGKIEPRWKPGESGNPNGKPKGTPNRSTIAKKVLEMINQPPEVILRKLKAMYPKYFAKKSEKWTTEMVMTLRIAQKAIIKGDVQAYEKLLDSAYGKKSEVDITSGGKPIPLLENVRRNNRNKKNTETSKEN